MSELHDAWLKDAFGLDVASSLADAEDGFPTSADETAAPAAHSAEHQDATRSIPERAQPYKSGKAAASTSMPTLKEGASGPAVEDLQNLLNNGASLKADGRFGAQTTGAVKSFQSSNGLKADGIVGVKTWQALSRAQPPQPKPVPKPPHEIRRVVVMVTDEATNDAIGGAMVRIAGQSEPTGDTGQATFSLPSLRTPTWSQRTAIGRPPELAP